MSEPMDCFRDGKPIGYSDGHDAGCDGPSLGDTPCPVCDCYLGHLDKKYFPLKGVDDDFEITAGAW